MITRFPFWIAKILEMDDRHEKLKVHWMVLPVYFSFPALTDDDSLPDDVKTYIDNLHCIDYQL
jgi:hypothetical protein